MSVPQTNGVHHIDALHEASEAGGLEEDIGSFLFSSESVGEGHPGESSSETELLLLLLLLVVVVVVNLVSIRSSRGFKFRSNSFIF